MQYGTNFMTCFSVNPFGQSLAFINYSSRAIFTQLSFQMCSCIVLRKSHKCNILKLCPKMSMIMETEGGQRGDLTMEGGYS